MLSINALFSLLTIRYIASTIIKIGLTLSTLNNKTLLGFIFFFLLFFSYFIYRQGLTGIFIFDDIPNLSPMGRYNELGFWSDFWVFLLEGNSGPTGRPISLASFYLNDSQWPSLPLSFIKTNILIHLLNGVLVFWFCFKLSKILKIAKTYQTGFALLVTAVWLLHPMHTTTVLYIVQRMTELSATFMLTGVLFYLYGRKKLFTNQLSGFLLLYIGVGISLLLAILSKENGILLVAFILVIELFLLQAFKNNPPPRFNYWFLPAIVFPFACVLIYLGLKTDPNSFINRDFSLSERLLTEPRILFDYLYHIFIPNMNYITVFHDNYPISTSLIKPWTTIVAIVSLVSLVLFAFMGRKKYPLISFAIAWFFAGHLIESTVLPLELYFEHRNYLPMLGIFISLAWYAIKFFETQKTLVVSIASLVLVLNTFILFQNTKLWGDPLELGISWFQNHPKSERSRLLYVSVMEAAGIILTTEQKKPITSSSSQFYSSSTLLELKNACINNSITERQLNTTVNILKKSIIHISAKTRFLEFMSKWEKGYCKNISSEVMEHFLIKLTSLKNIQSHQYIAHDIHYKLSELYKEKRDFQKLMYHLDKAYAYNPNIKLLRLKAFYLTSAGLYQEALNTLNDTSLLETTFRKKLAMKIKQKELEQLKQAIREKMKLAAK